MREARFAPACALREGCESKVCAVTSVVKPALPAVPKRSVTQVWEYREFLGNLLRRELHKNYRGSLLGWFWSLINPLTTLAVYSFVFGTILPGRRALPQDTPLVSFAHFLFAALVMWNIFLNVSNGMMMSFTKAVNLRKRVYFPAEAPGIATTLASLVTAAIEILVLVLAFVIFGEVSVTFLHLIPIALLTAVFSMGVGFALSPASIRYKDVSYLHGVVLRFLFFLTPMIYPLSAVPEEKFGLPLRTMMSAHPLARITDASRAAAYRQEHLSVGDYAYLIVAATVSLVVGWLIFRRSADRVAEGN